MSALGRGTSSDPFEPALEIGIILEFLMVQPVRDNPWATCDVRDGVVARDVASTFELSMQDAVKACCLYLERNLGQSGAPFNPTLPHPKRARDAALRRIIRCWWFARGGFWPPDAGVQQGTRLASEDE